MMYSGLPRKNRIAIQIALSAAWMFSGIAGLSAVVLPPNTISAELGELGTVASAVVLTVATGTAALGVILSCYRWEWVASWIAAAAIIPYLVTVWALVFVETPSRSMQAFLVTSLLLFYVTRALLCAAHAAKLREAHKAEEIVIRSVSGEGDDSGDGRVGGI